MNESTPGLIRLVYALVGILLAGFKDELNGQRSQDVAAKHRSKVRTSTPGSSGSRIIFVSRQDAPLFRPTRGRALYAYTHAWLTTARLFHGESISRALAIRMAGSRTVSYHLKQGNLTEIGDRIALSPRGHANFLSRGIAHHEAAEWLQFFQHGNGPRAKAIGHRVESVPLDARAHEVRGDCSSNQHLSSPVPLEPLDR